jgi:hypothetical protein
MGHRRKSALPDRGSWKGSTQPCGQASGAVVQGQGGKGTSQYRTLSRQVTLRNEAVANRPIGHSAEHPVRVLAAEGPTCPRDGPCSTRARDVLEPVLRELVAIQICHNGNWRPRSWRAGRPSDCPGLMEASLPSWRS